MNISFIFPPFYSEIKPTSEKKLNYGCKILKATQSEEKKNERLEQVLIPKFSFFRPFHSIALL